MTEILRRGTETVVVEDEDCSDTFDSCFVSVRFRGVLLPGEIFLVQALSACWLLVFPKCLSDLFSLLESTKQRKRVSLNVAQSEGA